MKIHRFYTGTELELKHDFWINGGPLAHQMVNVLRLRAGEQVELFDGSGTDRLYSIAMVEPPLSVHFQLVTELEPRRPHREVYLLFTLLKKDKNEWVLQKCTELGVSHFIPILSERTEKTGFDELRAQKIVTEAAEQCGRSDIPFVREPMNLSTALAEYQDKIQLYIAQQSQDTAPASDILDSRLTTHDSSIPALGVFVGPEGGWSQTELTQFTDAHVAQLGLGHFTLRAETACVSAAGKLMNI
jgi:16S rRNA (uracil1498-N3)-methyltransferase